MSDTFKTVESKQIGTIDINEDIRPYEEAIEKSGCNIWIKTSGNTRILILRNGDDTSFWEVLHSLKDS